MQPGLLTIASRLPSSDGLWHLRYPAGNAPPMGAALAGSASVASAVSAALTTGIKLAASPSAASSATAALTTGSSGFTPQSGYSLAAPSGISEGELVTLSGSGFGSIGPQLLYYKNFANETVGSRLINGPDFIASSLVTASANGNGYPYVVSDAGLPYGQGMIVSNDSRVGTVGSGGGWGGIKIAFSSLIRELFTSGVHYFPSSCSYSPLVSAGNPQVKIDWAYANTIADTDIYNKICNGAIALAYVMDSDTAPWDGLQIGTNTEWVWASGPYPKTGVPICSDRWVQLNAPVGSGTGNIMWVGVWDGTTNTINAYNNGLVMAASGSANNGYNTLSIPGFVQDSSATNPNWNYQNNAYIVEGEVYVAGASSGNQGAAARIEIGDASTYATCTRKAKCTVESPSWWGGSAVQFRLHMGVFSASGLSGKYLYATSASNVTTLVGQFQ